MAEHPKLVAPQAVSLGVVPYTLRQDALIMPFQWPFLPPCSHIRKPQQCYPRG
jgi:hypothetical protein